MRVIIGYSTCPLTRAAFERQGHDVWTCDLRGDPHPKHIQDDIWQHADGEWDFGVFHPMCTYMTVSAAWAYADPDFERYPGDGYHQRPKGGTLTGGARRLARLAAVANFKRLDALPYPHAIENPGRSFLSTMYRKPDFTVQPFQFGDDASKLTGFWVSPGVPVLTPTALIQPRIVGGKPRWANQTDSGQNRLSPSKERWIERSKTYSGIANAMGDQWGKWIRGARK